MDKSNPIFIGGAARSGTTLLVDLMGLHPNLSPIYETFFLIQVIKMLSRYRWISRILGPLRIRRFMRHACRTLPSSRISEIRGTNEVFFHGPNFVLLEPKFVMEQTARLEKRIRWGKQNEALHAFITTLFAKHCQNDGKPRWVNKTPININYWRELYDVFPEMRFIHCVRDGRDALCSNIHRRGTGIMTKYTARWIDAIHQGQAFAAKHPNQYLEIKYENLLENPQQELDGIFSWLGEEPCAEQALQKYSESGLHIYPSRVGNWKSELSREHLDEFERIAGNLLDQLGYRDE